jgi:hypothetical protein
MQRPQFAIIASPMVGEKRGSTRESKPKSISVCEGPKSFLEPFEDDLLMWLLELQQEGIPIECQRNPEEMRNAAREFVTAFRPCLVTPDRDKQFVINMDQTPRLNSSMPTISTTTPLGWNAMLPMVLVYEV